MIRFTREPLADHVAIDPLDDLESLGDQIAELAAHLHAATHRMLALIARFDRRFQEAGGGTGFRSTAHWLSWRTGIGLGAAREKVRVSRALEELPLISAQMERGRLSFSKVRALTRVATPGNESTLLEFAQQGTASHVERLVRAWRTVDRQEEVAKDELRRASRHLSLYLDHDGTWILRGRLEPEIGALLKRALDAATDRLAQSVPEPEEITPRQRQADAIGLLAECALGDGMDDRASRTDRFQVVLHVDEERVRSEGPEGSEGSSLEAAAGPSEGAQPAAGAGAADGAQVGDAAGAAVGAMVEAISGVQVDGQAVLEDGIRVSAETSRRLACDASSVIMGHGENGKVLSVGRRTRRISTAMRRALDHRDVRCRFPGCELRICDSHHIRHWIDGGETSLDNLVFLCPYHHRAVHEGGFRVEASASERRSVPILRFFRPDGRPFPDAPVSPELASDPVKALREEHERLGFRPDPSTTQPGWCGESFDPGLALYMMRA